MTLIFRPTPKKQASLPLGNSFQLTLSGVVQDSHVQVSRAHMSKISSRPCIASKWPGMQGSASASRVMSSLSTQIAGSGCPTPGGANSSFQWSSTAPDRVICKWKHC